MQVTVPMTPARQPLLSPPSMTSEVREEQVGCRNKWKICQLSKAAIALIVIHAVVGASYSSFLNASMWLGYSIGNVIMTVIGVYSLVAIITLLSPLNGFLADVRYGRYRIVHIGLSVMSVAFLILSINALLTMIIGVMVWRNYNIALYVILLLLTTLSFLLFFIGHAGYQANLIPFGLDQLLEAPSASLALFIHWIIWADSLGMLIIQVLFGGLMCKYRSEYFIYLSCSLILILTACFLLIVICLRRHCFFSELVHHNPYKMVIMVLNSARKHSHLALIASIQNSLSLC